MNDELIEYLISELGFDRKLEAPAGLHQASEAFLGAFLSQRTPIQGLAIEAIYNGEDALLIAATASGKTEAAMVPIAARLLTDADASLALYVAPTRALLNDLLKRLSAPLHQLGLEARVRHGDFALPAQTASIRVLFTTPESLDVMLSNKTTLLARTKYVVIDEIHQLFGGSRGDQLGFLIQRLRRVAQSTPQIIGLSATLGNPNTVAAWLCPHGTPARIITDPRRRQIVASFRWQSDSTIFRRLLREGGHDKVLIFANSRRRCDDIFLAVRGCEPYEVYVHFSTLEKEEREHVERGIKTNAFAACVATSTLELGEELLGLRLAGALDWFWTFVGYLSEGRSWLEGALAPATVSAPQTAEARARALWAAGGIAWLQGNYVAARPSLEESAAIYRELGDERGLAYALMWLGLVKRDQGDPDAGRTSLEASVAIFRKIGDQWSLAVGLVSLGRAVVMAGDPRAARPVLEEGGAMFEEMGDRWGQAISLGNLGLVALRQGDYDWASALYKEGLRLFWQQGDIVFTARCLEELAWVACRRGDYERAARLFGTAEALREEIRVALPPAAHAEHDQTVAAVRARLDEATLKTAWAEGRAMTMEQAMDYALETINEN